MENYARAETCLAQCIEKAEAGGFRDLVFFARKDLALLRLAQGEPDRAESELAAAEKTMPREADAYFPLLLSAARGETLRARADERAIPLLAETVKGFEEMDLPDEEIPARISVGQSVRAMEIQGARGAVPAARIAHPRADGFARYLPVLNGPWPGWSWSRAR